MRYFPFVILIAFLAIPASANSAEQFPHSKLFKSTRALMAEARVRGGREFGVVIAAAPGASARVAAAIEAVGGRVERRVGEVDYIRAKLPLGKVEALANLATVEAIDADAEITTLNIAGQLAAPDSPAGAKPRRTAKDEAPLLHPYLPGKDMGTFALRAAHPTFDGRGATVALIDSAPDFLLPQFQNAKALDGSSVPKIVDILTSTDPKSEPPEYSSWLNMSARVRASGGTFTFKGIQYSAPHDGDFRLGFIRNNGFFSSLIDPKAKPKPKKDAPLFAVAWDEQTNTVWVDTNNDHNFADEKALDDYAINHDYGTFAVHPDDPEARPTVGFVVQTDRRQHSVAILLGNGSHASGAGGTAVGAGLNNGKFDNIAPGARLVSISPNYESHGLIEAVIKAEQDPRVDLVCIEVISAESYGFKDGHFTQSVIYNRLTHKYNKPILQPADNDKGLSKIEEAGIPQDVLSVGAYQSKESLRVDAGIDVPDNDNLHFVSAFGPTNNGGFKPTILAPSGYVSLDNGFEASRVLKGVFNLPPGYQMFGGTSQATPTAAGAVAILISAARQSGFRFTVAHLIQALEDTARYLPSLPAYQQGPGLLQVDRAFSELQRLAAREPDTILLQAPVRTIVSRYLPAPNVGVGLYEREGWTAGLRGVRQLSLTRTSGNPGPKRFRLALEGNDGTFSLPDSVTLVRDVPAKLNVLLAPASAGVHSSVLRLIDVSTGANSLNAYLAIVAAQEFTPSRNYEVSSKLIVRRPGNASAFVRVPVGAQAMRVTLQTPRKMNFTALLPDSTEADVPANFYLGGSQIVPGSSTYLFPHPEPGVWELEAVDLTDNFSHDAKQQHPLRPTSVQLSASLIGVAASGGERQLNTGSELASIPNAIFAREKASFAEHLGIIQRGQQITYELRVPQGSTRLGATLRGDGDPHNQLDLYVFDCTKKCHLKYRTIHYDGANEAFVESPAPGKWKIVVDAYAARGDGARFHYLDYVSTPVQGMGSNQGRYTGTLFTLSLFGNDPDLYDNEVGGGPVTPRKGQNPIMVTAFPLAR